MQRIIHFSYAESRQNKTTAIMCFYVNGLMDIVKRYNTWSLKLTS